MRVLTRREFSRWLAGLGAACVVPRATAEQPAAGAFVTRAIPASGERVPAVGLGTARVFDVGDDSSGRAALAQVLQTLVAGGGAIVDTASSYGSAESVLGDLVALAGLRGRLFIATKLEAPDDEEFRTSLRRLRTPTVDLLMLHNVRDPNQSLEKFRAWKAAGLCRHVGVSSTFHRDYPAVEAVLRREKPDFLEIDYSLDDREAEKRLLPLAAQVGTAVLTALPFGRGRLFRAVRGKTLPDWAAEFDARSWAQFFLKFLLGHESVTAVIPGTAKAAHMADNLGAQRGRLPDAAQRLRMIRYVESL
jgi:aryl-alcohol dehydrogenase-like predicted oxidoreductase